MWGSDDSFDAKGGKKGGGGGFVNSPGLDQSGDKSRGKRSQNIVPVTIRQILESSDENIKIEDQEASVVTIVGLVTQVEQTTVKISFTIDDQTGSIEALKYVGDTDGGGAKQVMLMEGTYARIVGVVRNQKGQSGRYIVMYKAMPVRDMNEVTCHILEVCQVPIKLKKLQEQEATKIGFGGTQMNQSSFPSMMGTSLGGGNNNSFGNNSSAGGMPGLNANQNMVFRAIQSVPGEEGVHIDTIIQNLKNKLNPKEIKDTIEFLSGEGHVYSTKDDDHFKTTDW